MRPSQRRIQPVSLSLGLGRIGKRQGAVQDRDEGIGDLEAETRSEAIPAARWAAARRRGGRARDRGQGTRDCPTHGITGRRSNTPAARRKKWSQLVRSLPRSTKSPAISTARASGRFLWGRPAACPTLPGHTEGRRRTSSRHRTRAPVRSGSSSMPTCQPAFHRPPNTCKPSRAPGPPRARCAGVLRGREQVGNRDRPPMPRDLTSRRLITFSLVDTDDRVLHVRCSPANSG